MPSMACELIVIRHGETAWNAEGRIQGHRSVGLNARGLRQAAALAERMRDEGFDVLVSSDLPRALQTAHSIATATGHDVVPDTRLREWKLGVLEGLTPAEAEQAAPESFRSYRDRLPDGAVEGGETVRARFSRVTEATVEIASRHDGQSVVLVTHGGPLDDLRRFADGMAIGGKPDFELYNAGIHRFRAADGRLEVLCWGDVAHLAEVGSMGDW